MLKCSFRTVYCVNRIGFRAITFKFPGEELLVYICESLLESSIRGSTFGGIKIRYNSLNQICLLFHFQMIRKLLPRCVATGLVCSQDAVACDPGTDVGRALGVTGDPFRRNSVTGGYTAYGLVRLPESFLIDPKPLGSLGYLRDIKQLL